MQKPYLDVIDFAFFVVNFGYSREDYDNLTNTERLFIRKAYENKVVSDTTLIRDAVCNAMHNAYRKKGAAFMELWKERKPVDKKEVKADMAFVARVEKKEAGWVDMIYQNAGLKKPKKKKKK